MMNTEKREILRMDSDWLFHRGDVPYEKIIEHMYTYDLCKASRGHGPASVSFTDEDWEHVQLPHDYLIEGDVSETENSFKGSYSRPNAWYRKYFKLEKEDRKKRLVLSFEGIAAHSIIYLNGHLLKRSFSGYTGFEIDITDFCRYEDELNVISVYIKNHESEGWWYEGAGIYRHVYLIKTGFTAVDTWGTFVKTMKEACDLWNTRVETKIRNNQFCDVKGKLVSTIISNADGKKIGCQETEFSVKSRSVVTCESEIYVANPKLWDCENPNLYTLHSQIYVENQLEDDYCTTFGYRTLCYDPDRGFLLNDVPTKIKGLCIHQDHGGLGSAVPDDVFEYRIQMLKSTGANAIRSTHNPAPPAFLDACDRLGMMVMDENRWLVSSKQRISELESMILRGRNHPSIILWSVFNEDPILEKPAGSNMFHTMHEYAKKLDDTRAIIGAPVKNVGAEDYIRSSDVMGFNYNFDQVDLLHKCWHKPHVNTETHQGNYTGGNDGWRLAALRPYVMGIFCWGVETRGETYWPRLFAPWGIMDNLCNPKIHYELYRNSYWAKEQSIKIVPMLDYPHIMDTSPCWLYADKKRSGIHWNPRILTGKTVDVWVYTTAPKVELLLNGKSLGTRYVDPFEQVCFHVEYQPGELVAIGKDKNGHEIVRDVLCTTMEPVSIAFDVFHKELRSNGADCSVITVLAVDQNNLLVADADDIPIHVSIEGPGEILAISNNEPTDHHNPKDPNAVLWNGKSQIIVRAGISAGQIIVHVDSPILGQNECVINVTEPDEKTALPSVENQASCFISSLEVGNYFETLSDMAEADFAGKITWTRKRFDKRLFTDMPVGYNVLPYKMELNIPQDAKALFFEHLIGRIHMQLLNEEKQVVLDFRDENKEERFTLKLPEGISGKQATLYVSTEIDPPTYFGPNPYWRFIGMYGISRWLFDPKKINMK